MSYPDLEFVNGKGFWRSQQDSVLFFGRREGKDFRFLITAQAIARADGRDGNPSAQEAMALFVDHYDVIRSIAHEMWALSDQSQEEYWITEEQVDARLG